jgi:amidohydrolase
MTGSSSPAPTPPSPGSDPGVAAFLDRFLDAQREELIAFRRTLHAHPERSGEEHETTERVAERLRVAGLAPRLLPGGTGLVCDVRGPAPGRTVALRADLDALAMDDEKDVPYRSQVPGVAHACGHDVHTTVVLGAGLALARVLTEPGAPAGGVRLLFQPAEEALPGGALEVIDAGGLDGVDLVYGLHCEPKLTTGRIGTRVGAITSAADLLTIRLHGPGGHTARPELTVDLVAEGARLARELPAALRERHPALALVFGSFHAGDAPNVIPATAELAGTLRTADRDAWDDAPRALAEALAALLAPTGADFELDHVRGVPPVVNDEHATRLLGTAAAEALGPGAVVPAGPSAGGDDFSWYAERVPRSYARLGVHPPGDPAPPRDLHASTFDVDEDAIAVGVRVLVATALAGLRA